MSSMLEEDQRAGYCRHCGERLALIKRVKREEFCSEEHRERYLSSTHAVALNRLRESDLGLDMEEEVELVAGSALEPEPEPVREPPPPPMAGTIAPIAVNAPMLLAGFWDADEGRLGQWEPIKPEPTWQHLALRFELAAFSDSGPAMFRQTAVVARVDNPPEHLDLAVNLPRNGIGIEQGEAEAGNGSQPSRPAAEFDLPQQDYQLAGALEPYRSTQGAVSIEAEAVEIDSTMYLPAFSPAASDSSQAGGAWSCAPYLGATWPDAPSLMLALQRANETEEPVWTDTQLEIPLSSGCVLDTAPPAPDPLYEAEQDPRELEELFEQPAAETAPKNENVDRVVVEERGMSEAVQTIAEGLGTQALGTRIASPFLQEPQPRPGSGKPRWTPVTVSLGTNLEGSTEDWDIL